MKRKNKEKKLFWKNNNLSITAANCETASNWWANCLCSDVNNDGTDKEFVFLFSASVLDYLPQSKNVQD